MTPKCVLWPWHVITMVMAGRKPTVSCERIPNWSDAIIASNLSSKLVNYNWEEFSADYFKVYESEPKVSSVGPHNHALSILKDAFEDGTQGNGSVNATVDDQKCKKAGKSSDQGIASTSGNTTFLEGVASIHRHGEHKDVMSEAYKANSRNHRQSKHAELFISTMNDLSDVQKSEGAPSEVQVHQKDPMALSAPVIVGMLVGGAILSGLMIWYCFGREEPGYLCVQHPNGMVTQHNAQDQGKGHECAHQPKLKRSGSEDSISDGSDSDVEGAHDLTFHASSLKERVEKPTAFEGTLVQVVSVKKFEDVHDVHDDEEEFEIALKYKEYAWTVHKTKTEVLQLHGSEQMHSYFKADGNELPTLALNFVVGDIDATKCRDLQEYLGKLFACAMAWRRARLRYFIEVSPLSFTHHPPFKPKEGYLWKSWGGRLRASGWMYSIVRCGLCRRCCARRRQRWIVNTGDSLLYCKYDDKYFEVLDSVLFGESTVVVLGSVDKGTHKSSFVVSTGARDLKLTAKRMEDSVRWSQSIQASLGSSHWTRLNPYSSFAPPREGLVQPLVDGKDYMQTLYEVLDLAVSEICISGWQFTPELPLKRPVSQYPEAQLHRILEKKAKQGVLVKVMLYSEVEIAGMTNASKHAQHVLSMHPNVQIQRHPDHGIRAASGSGALNFSHHEKVVVVDKCIAFMGGIDLAVGRWDDSHEHALADPNGSAFPGKDYVNPCVGEPSGEQMQYFDVDHLDRQSQPRMPWHDVHFMAVGPVALDAYRNFSCIWNHCATDMKADLRKGTVEILYKYNKDVFDESIRQKKTLVVEDYLKAFNQSEVGDKAGLPNLQRKWLLDTMPIYLCPMQMLRSASTWSYGQPLEHSIRTQYIESIENSKSFIYIENQFFITNCTPEYERVSARISARVPEGETNPVQNRIGNAIVKRILRADAEGTPLKVYVVMPAMPAFKGDAIDAADAWPVRTVMRLQYQSIKRGNEALIEILKQNLKRRKWHEYLAFFSLRTWQQMPNGAVISNQIYIHSKVLIVDDELAFAGSANLNDRSMLGNRDSEVGVLFRKAESADSSFPAALRKRLWQEHLGILPCAHGTDGDPKGDSLAFTKPKSAYERGEYLEDPSGEECWSIFRRIAEENNAAYRAILKVWPDSSLKTYQQFNDNKQEIAQLPGTSTWDEIKNALAQRVHGRLIWFPIDFLENEDMEHPKPASATVVNSIVFT